MTRYLKLFGAGLFGALLAVSIPLLAQNWVVVNGASALSATNTTYTMLVRQDGTGDILRLSDAGTVVWSVADGGAVASTGASTLSLSSLGTTSTDGLVVQNTTAATGGATVQISPRIKLLGAGWDADDSVSRNTRFFAEVLPVSGNTVYGNLKIGYMNPVTDAITYPIQFDPLNLDLTITNANGSLAISGSAKFNFSTREILLSPADGLFSITNGSQNVGIQINTGTAAPTLANCGAAGGTLTTGRRNAAGEATPTNSNTSCDIVFGTPAWTNTPFCVIEDETTLQAARVSAISTTGFTVAGLTGGDKFMWICLGRI